MLVAMTAQASLDSRLLRVEPVRRMAARAAELRPARVGMHRAARAARRHGREPFGEPHAVLAREKALRLRVVAGDAGLVVRALHPRGGALRPGRLCSLVTAAAVDAGAR